MLSITAFNAQNTCYNITLNIKIGPNQLMSRAKKQLNEKLGCNGSEKTQVILAMQEQELTIQQAIDRAVQHHQAGDLLKAESIYQQILQADPNQPIAFNLLGLIAHQVGKNDIAANYIIKAIAIKPDYPDAYSNLGNVLRELGRFNKAVVNYNKALNIEPNLVEAY